ncbi:MAG TPA: hypothetical protein PK819_14795, partial [Thermomicrobiales bacterium]|nr:hypothetical protein [Thermomicrobiales bacterium]
MDAHRNTSGWLMVVALVLALVLQAAPVQTAHAQDDPDITQREFTSLIDEATATDPVYGPEDGSLELLSDKIAFQNANVDLGDLLVQATFTNPVASTRHSFDYGITIRERNNGIAAAFLTFIVFESGIWAVVDGDQNILLNDTYDDFNGRRDATNTLTIYANQGVVHVGINGDLLGSIETDIVLPGNVWLGAGF